MRVLLNLHNHIWTVEVFGIRPLTMDLAEAPPLPKLDDAAFERLQAALATEGPVAAIELLIAELRQLGDFNNLFYALLLKKRVELGVSPFPTGPASELPPETHEAYEQTIRESGRLVGQIYLDRGDLPKAWAFFRMLGEPEPVARRGQGSARGRPDIYPLIEIAWQHGVLPKKGFDLVLDRHGVCSAITMVSSSDLNANTDLRDYCVGKLIRSLHEQLTDRLRVDRNPGSGFSGRCHDPAIDPGPAGVIQRRWLPYRSVAPIECGSDESKRAARGGTRSGRELCDYGRLITPGVCASPPIRRLKIYMRIILPISW